MKKPQNFIVIVLICIFTGIQSNAQEINLVTGRSHIKGFLSAKFFSDNKRVLSSSMYNTPKVWDITRKKVVFDFSLSDDFRWIIDPAAMSLNEKKIYYMAHDSASVWDAETGKHLCNIPSNSFNFKPLFSPDGSMIITMKQIDKHAYVWDSKSGKELYELNHDSDPEKAVFSPDGSIIATSAGFSTICLWESKTGKLILKLSDISIGIFDKIQFSPNGKEILCITNNYHVNIWDIKTGTLKLDKLIYGASQASELEPDFSPDGKYFLVETGEEDTVGIYESETGKLHASFVAGKPLEYATFSPDGKVILTKLVNAVSLKIWNAYNGALIAELAGHKASIVSAQFNNSGNKIVTASSDMTAKVWDAATGKLLFDLKGHKDELRSAEFSTDDSKIVTASWDNTIKIWDANTGKLLETIKGK